MWYDRVLLLLSLAHITFQQQRVAPGVPPQHYQAPPPPQQFQQQAQFQQVPIQQHQVPVQQVQHQVPVQQVQHQVPVQHVPIQQTVNQHQQGIPIQHHQGGSGQLLNAANIAHEKEHIAEHLSVPIDTSKMSEQELQFHYFKMHDADNNNKLDGCELIKSLIHWHAEEDKLPGTGEDQGGPIQSDNELETLVDPILKEVDKNGDGFIDYTEFKKSEPARGR